MSTPEREPEPEPTPLEKRLASWRPATGGLDRDRMLFEAGRAARGAGSTRLWRAAAAVLALSTAGLGGLLARERMRRYDLEVQVAALTTLPEPARVMRVTEAPTPEPPPLPGPWSGSPVLSAHLGADGLDALASSDRRGPSDTGGTPPVGAGPTLRPRSPGRALEL